MFPADRCANKGSRCSVTFCGCVNADIKTGTDNCTMNKLLAHVI